MSFLKKSAKPFHTSRKLFHLLGLVFPILLEAKCFGFLSDYISDPTRTIQIYIVTFFIICLFLVDMLRFRYKACQLFFYRFWGRLLKKEEKNHHNASIPYFISYLLLLLFLPSPLIMTCCIFLMLADPGASYIGIRFGRVRFWNGKSLEGLVAFGIVSSFFGLLYFGIRTITHGYADPFSLWTTLGWNSNLLLCFYSGLACAAIVELVCPTLCKGLVDDNLLVPLVGAGGFISSAYIWNVYPITLLWITPFV